MGAEPRPVDRIPGAARPLRGGRTRARRAALRHAQLPRGLRAAVRPAQRPATPMSDPTTRPGLHLFQILNHYTPRGDLDPGFEVLDNSSNERPDWYEYWPIRRFLLG